MLSEIEGSSGECRMKARRAASYARLLDTGRVFGGGAEFLGKRQGLLPGQDSRARCRRGRRRRL